MRAASRVTAATLFTEDYVRKPAYIEILDAIAP